MIDERNLTIKADSLRALRVDTEQKLIEIMNVERSLNSIKLSDGNNPIDKSTNTEMSETRRQEIYDICIPIADDLLGIE